MAKRERKAEDEAADSAAATDDTDLIRPSGKPRGKRAAAGSESEAKGGKTGGSVAVKDRDEPKQPAVNPFVRIWTFIRQVVAEMRKVIWPTRRELINYSIAVLVFVAIITALIFGLDVGFGKLALIVFGSPS